MKVKDLITNGIKRIINEKNSDKKELNAQKYLIKREHIINLQKKDEYEREQKYNYILEKESKRNKIQTLKNRMHSSKIYRLNDIKKKQKKNIYKIQKLLKNGEGEDEENLDILMEEFPDNPRIAEIIQKYQIKKNNIENNYKPRPRLYSSHNINLFTNGNNATPWNRQISQSNDKRRIFIYANDRNDNKNDIIKKEERRINNTNPNKNNKKLNIN